MTRSPFYEWHMSSHNRHKRSVNIMKQDDTWHAWGGSTSPSVMSACHVTPTLCDFGYFGLQGFPLPYTSKLPNTELADSRSVALQGFGTSSFKGLHHIKLQISLTNELSNCASLEFRDSDTSVLRALEDFSTPSNNSSKRQTFEQSLICKYVSPNCEWFGLTLDFRTSEKTSPSDIRTKTLEWILDNL